MKVSSNPILCSHPYLYGLIEQANGTVSQALDEANGVPQDLQP